MGNSCDLFYHPPPLFPSSQLYLLRPLLPLDQVRATAQRGGPHHSGQSSPLRGLCCTCANEIRACLLLTLRLGLQCRVVEVGQDLQGPDPARSRPAWGRSPRAVSSSVLAPCAGRQVLWPAASAGTITCITVTSAQAQQQERETQLRSEWQAQLQVNWHRSGVARL